MTDESTPSHLSQLPPEMLDFTILKRTTTLAPRLGRLSLSSRKTILTPGFLGNTSRGIVPHVSQDNFPKTGINGVYIALEDFVEKHPQKTPPIFQIEASDPLRRFIALPHDSLIVLGARRQPPIPSAATNTNSEIGILTSVGFRTISSEYYAAAARKLQPDIVVGLADIPFGQETIGSRRKDKMSDRTETWTRDIIAKRNTIEKGTPRYNVFAPILPIEKELQSWYLEHLLDDMVDKISGVAIYDSHLLDQLPEELQPLPRLSFDNPTSPQALLRQVGLGMDLFTVPFVTEATDAGIALEFTFPAPQKTNGAERRSLGIDMWQNEHSESVIPLTEGCKCYACTKHHRAYIQHLLGAKEMLGWVLIQLHNHEILSAFFAGIRNSIETNNFEQDVAAFEVFYEPKLPEKTGSGPRVRGYQFQAQEHGKSTKKNPKAYKPLSAPLNVFHGHQPNSKPEVKEVIDDEALVGLVGIENIGRTEQLERLRIEDDHS
ncbi:tRNA-guanine transglycosylase [Lindgomyces ingoldianus]|uniref:tRNA-guanine transglycosylase n=1 Tax=Lindgomyces ingoldianus TaxID=673940 RepID=A0ACB6QRG9_9PLEO|nr:tRNA-guanine transglycosylase [Lindgomyces ingoldianus]KAF2469624.1 tRNA-guanine transglycosylase [Lindgomyces ingoldianus]